MMGNPAPQPRSNSPKTNAKPKHRHSGSVSNISFTSEDPKPKHRHTGSVSNISFTSEDLKPKHRHNGSVSNIPFTPEDLKPKHRQSGSVSNISITPPPEELRDLKPKHRQSGSVSNISITPPPEELRDLKPKHRRSGSVSSSITTNAEDFISPSRGDASRSNSPSSSVRSSLSAASLREKRNKRRTRSSLGGTEDFVKELDFLTTPLPNGRTPDSSNTRKEPNGRTLDASNTCKELLKSSPSPPFPESAPLQAAAEGLSPVSKASLPIHAEGSGECPALVEQLNDPVVQKASVGENGGFPFGEKFVDSANGGDIEGSSPQGEKSASAAVVGENGGSPHDEKSGSSAERDFVEPGEVAQLAQSDRNGVDRGSTGTAETSTDEHHPGLGGEKDHAVLDKTPLILENKSNVVDHEAVGEILPSLVNGQRPETASGLPPVVAVAEESDRSELVDIRKETEAEEAPDSTVERGLPTESLVSVNDGASIPTNTREQEGFTCSDDSTCLDNGGTAILLANGDSQVSPSKEEELSREEQAAKDTQEEEKVSVQKRIEELEKIAGGRPVHFRSQSLSLPRPFDVSHARHHEAEASKGFKLPAYKAPLDSTSVSELGGSELVGTSHQELAEGSLQREGSASTGGTLSATGLGVDGKYAQEIEPQEVPVFSESNKAVDVSADSTVNGTRLENWRTPESCEDLPANRAESMSEAEAPDVAKEYSNTQEQNEIERVNEERLESVLGEAPVIVSTDSVPKELPNQGAADQTEESGRKLEIVEPAPGALKSATLVEAHQMSALSEAVKTEMLPIAHQRGTCTEVPSVQASMAEQSSQDYETTMLLTKQPAVDPLFIDSQQDRLWEMHSQELTIGESSGQEVRESSAQDDDPRQYLNGTPTHAEVTPSGSAANGNAQSDKSSKVDRPRTPLRSLLAEEDAEKCPDSGPIGTPPQNQSVSPRGNLFKRIVSGGKNSPTKQSTPTKFSPKNQTAAKPFLSSCICCSVK